MFTASILRASIVAVVIGVVLGTMSWWFDRLPVDSPLIVLVAMANAGGPWMVAAFLAGSRFPSTRHAALGGFTALGVAVAVYYAGLALASQMADIARLAALVWLGAAALAGPLFGAAGRLWAAGADRGRVVGVAILAGGLLAEAAYRFVELEAWDGIDLARTSMQVAAVDTAFAVALPILLVRRHGWGAAYATSLCVGIGGFAAISVAMLAIQTILFGGPV